MPEINGPDDVRAEFERLNKSIEALRSEAGNRAAAASQIEASLQKIQQAQVAQALSQRAETPDSDLDDHMIDRADAEELLLEAPHLTRGYHYAVPEGGSGDVVALRTIQTDQGTIPGLLDTPYHTPWASRLKQIVTDKNVLQFAARSGRGGSIPKGYGMLLKQANRALKRHLLKAPTPELRAIFTADRVERLFNYSSTEGQELVFDYDMPMLAERVDMESPISGLFRQVQVSEGRKVTVPTLSGGITPFLKNAATEDDPPKYRKSSGIFGSETYEMIGFAVATQLDEDTADDVTWTNAASLFTAQLARAMAWAREDAIINGDTTSPHQDTLSGWNNRNMFTTALLGGSDDHRRAWIGLRALAADRSAAASGSGDANIGVTLRTARAGVTAPYGLGEVVHLISYNQFLSELVAHDDFKTLDAYGQLATRISGSVTGPLPNQVGVIDGVPVCIAWFLSDAMETSGLYTDGTGGKSGVLTVARDRFQMMVRRANRIEVAKDINRGVWDQVLTCRELFAVDPSVTDSQSPVYYRYNL